MVERTLTFCDSKFSKQLRTLIYPPWSRPLVISRKVILLANSAGDADMAHSCRESCHGTIKPSLSGSWVLPFSDRSFFMSLHPQPVGPVPDDTARVARAAFPRGNFCLRL